MSGDEGRETELRAQLELAQSVAQMGSWEWDLASGTVSWTDELFRIYGLPPRSRTITFEFFLSCLVPDDRARIGHAIETALQQRGKFAYRETIVRPGGEQRVLDTIGQTLLDPAGNVLKLVGTCRDITDAARLDVHLEFYGQVFASVSIGLSAWQIDRRAEPAVFRLVAVNAATAALIGRSLDGQLGRCIAEVFPDPAGDAIADAARAMIAGDPAARVAPVRLGANMAEVTLFALPGQTVGIALEDITTRHRAQVVQEGEHRALQMLAEGAPLEAILESLVGVIEQVMEGMIASILLIDDDGQHVRHGAAPHLPPAYVRAIDGTAIGPEAGSCGTAAYRREPVYAVDITTDPHWQGYRELAAVHGLRACWSFPILSSQGGVLGTFALYDRVPCAPSAVAIEVMARAAHVAGIVLERRALDERLRALTGRIETAREEERTAIARDIHDQLGQALTALRLDIGWLMRHQGEKGVETKLFEMTGATDEILRTVRRISADLRPSVLDDLGLVAAIEWQAEEFAKRTQTVCEVATDVDTLAIDRTLATTVFRIFQESLTNIARHASAQRVDITLTCTADELRLDIADDGVGLPEIGPRNSTLGILGMGERARRLGGECTVKRRTPRGTIVTLVMPLRATTTRTG